MPGKVWLMNVAGFILQYVFLLLIYYFIYRIVRIIFQDLCPSALPNDLKSSKKTVEVSARLIVIDTFSGHLAGEVISLGEAIAIGRGEGNDIVVDDSCVSHEHSCITYYKNNYWLADLRSTNHTYLNDRIVTEEVKLKSGDLIKIGRVTFKFER
ncbi:MAG: domain containing protein [Firmicutes bacterium]|nr:domain containing protein [Bacillota bacterium]